MKFSANQHLAKLLTLVIFCAVVNLNPGLLHRERAMRQLQIAGTVQVKIIMVPSFPMTQCTIGTQQTITKQSTSAPVTISSHKFFGYEYEMIRETIQNLYSNYVIDFTCTDAVNFESSIKSQSATNSDVIVLGFGSRVLSLENMSGGLQPSLTTFTNNMRLISRKNERMRYWTFALPLSWQVAGLLAILALSVAMLLWLFEDRSIDKSTKTKLWLNFLQMLFEVFSSFFFTNALRLKEISSRFLVWALCFIILLFLGIYQSHLVMKISTSFYEPELPSFDFAIQNKKMIGIFSEYKDIMATTYNKTISYKYYSQGDSLTTAINSMFDDVIQQSLDGIIIDEQIANYYCPQYCKTRKSEDIILKLNYAAFFHPDTASAAISNFNAKYLQIKNSKFGDNMYKKIFEMRQFTDCDEKEDNADITQLTGLWIMIGIGFVFALIIWALKKSFEVKLNYQSPFIDYLNENTPIFEQQLKKMVELEVQQILDASKESIFNYVSKYEKTIMLQQVDNSLPYYAKQLQKSQFDADDIQYTKSNMLSYKIKND